VAPASAPGANRSFPASDIKAGSGGTRTSEQEVGENMGM